MTLFVICLALVTFLQSAGVTGRTSRGPDNAVATVGASITMECSTGIKGCSSVDWLKIEPFNNVSIYWSYAGISEPFRDRYEVDETVGCDLIVSKLRMSDAGLFVCKIANVDSLSASLIVLESSQSCERTPVDSESDTLAYSCELTFGGIVDRVAMAWLYASNGTQVERVPPQIQTGGTVSRYFSRSAEQLPEDQALRCVTRFRVPAERNRATNVPEVKCEPSDSWLSSVEDLTLTLTDFPPISPMYEDRKTPVVYIVVGIVVFALAILALALFLCCAGVNLSCCA